MPDFKTELTYSHSHACSQHTHTHTHELSMRCCVLRCQSHDFLPRLKFTHHIGWPHCAASWHKCVRARKDTHARTRKHSVVDWLDYTSGAAQPDRGTSTKKETRKEYKRLICPCCISMFHLPTLAYPHPHRLDPITTARTRSYNTNIPVWRNIAVEFFFHNLFPLHPHMHIVRGWEGDGGKRRDGRRKWKEKRWREGGRERGREGERSSWEPGGSCYSNWVSIPVNQIYFRHLASMEKNAEKTAIRVTESFFTEAKLSANAHALILANCKLLDWSH